MIRRDILEHPERVETMDLFNDSEDTIAFLKRVQYQKNAAAKIQPVIDRIEQRFQEFLKTWQKSSS